MTKSVFLRIIAVALLVSLCVPFFSCTKKDDGEKIKIVCTLFAQYDWLRNIIGESDNVALSLLVDNGADVHSYQPTAADIMEISDCDMIVYLGSDIDTWVIEALERADNENTLKFAMTEREGITMHNISSESGHHSHDGHDHSHDALDEHVWLSLKNAVFFTGELCKVICELDPDGAESYRANAERYMGELLSLDAEFFAAVQNAKKDFMLFCDRFPFVYLLEDYGIKYAAAFEGCSADVDADFATVLRMIKEADEHSLDCLIVTESSDRALANTVASSAKCEIERVLIMDSLQSVGAKRIDSGVTYLSAMRENLGVLKLALGVE